MGRVSHKETSPQPLGKKTGQLRKKEIIDAQLRGEHVWVGEGDNHKRKSEMK